MTSILLRHDAAWMITARIMDVFSGVLMDSERIDAFRETLARITEGLAQYELALDRMDKRLLGLPTK